MCSSGGSAEYRSVEAAPPSADGMPTPASTSRFPGGPFAPGGGYCRSWSSFFDGSCAVCRKRPRRRRFRGFLRPLPPIPCTARRRCPESPAAASLHPEGATAEVGAPSSTDLAPRVENDRGGADFGACSDRCLHPVQNRGATADSESISLLHELVALPRSSVDLRAQPAVEQGHDHRAQVRSACHPLEVASSGVVVGSVQAAPRKRGHHPAEERLVRDVHAERDLGLSAVAAKMPFPDEDSQENADLQVSRDCCFTVRSHVKRSPPSLLFHRKVSRETDRPSDALGKRAISGRYGPKLLE